MRKLVGWSILSLMAAMVFGEFQKQPEDYRLEAAAQYCLNDALDVKACGRQAVAEYDGAKRARRAADRN